MKIIVTGSTGLVGNAIRKESEKTKYNKHEFIFISSKDADLRNYEETYSLIKYYKCDAIIHLAANVGGLFKNLSQKVQMLEDNLYINTNIIKAAHENNVNTFVGILSTCIFPNKTEYPINEEMLHDGPPHISNAEYAHAKRMMEVQCHAYCTQYNRNYFCIIPTNIYGPHDNFDLMNAHVIPALIHKCYLAKIREVPFTIAGTGLPLRQFIYSKDLAYIILYLLLQCPKKKGNIIVSVPESHEVTIEYISKLITEEFDYYNTRFDTSKSDGQYKKTADNKKLMTLLPEDFEFTSIESGMKDTIKWFLKNYSENSEKEKELPLSKLDSLAEFVAYSSSDSEEYEEEEESLE